MGTRTQCEQTGSSSPLPVYNASATQACRVSSEKSPMKICYPMFYCWITSWRKREREKNFTAPQTNWEGRERGKEEGGQASTEPKMLVGLLHFPLRLLLCCHFLLDWWGSLFWKFHIKHSTTQVHIKVLQARLDEMKTALADTQRNNYSPSHSHLSKHHFKTGQWANIEHKEGNRRQERAHIHLPFS